MVLIHGKHYNLDHFNHPGGNEILELCKNEPDCTALFESYHAFCDMTKIHNIMKNYHDPHDNTPVKNMFNFKSNGFYNTCKEAIVTKLNLNRENSKANIEWFTTVCFSSFLFILFQFIYLSFNNSLLKIISSLCSGLTLVSFGYNILHDASHYAVSKYPVVNNILSRLYSALLLSNHTLWSYHHCIRHHQYTGDIIFDPDMRNSRPFFRKSEKFTPRKGEFSKTYLGFKLLLFNIIFPGTMLGQSLSYHLVWARRKKIWNMNLPENYFNPWTILQYTISLLFCFFEIYYGGIYFLFHIIGTNIGFFVGTAPDHDMYCTHQEISNSNNELDWGEIQVRHSANFMNTNHLFTKFYGGINYQIEHHLFPTLSNHKLIIIAPIVKECCKKFNIPYNSIESPKKIWQELIRTYENVHS